MDCGPKAVIHNDAEPARLYPHVVVQDVVILGVRHP